VTGGTTVMQKVVYEAAAENGVDVTGGTTVMQKALGTLADPAERDILTRWRSFG